MNDLYFREGNVILYRRDRSKYFQARIKLQNNKSKEDIKSYVEILCKTLEYIVVNTEIDYQKYFENDETFSNVYFSERSLCFLNSLLTKNFI